MDIFKSFYLGVSHVFSKKVGCTNTYVWQGILEVSSMVKQGYRFKISNGKNVKVWMDRWAGESPLIKLISPDTTNLIDLNLQVKDITSKRAWELSNLGRLLDTTLSRISTATLPLYNYLDMTKSAYH